MLCYYNSQNPPSIFPNPKIKEYAVWFRFQLLIILLLHIEREREAVRSDQWCKHPCMYICMYCDYLCNVYSILHEWKWKGNKLKVQLDNGMSFVHIDVDSNEADLLCLYHPYSFNLKLFRLLEMTLNKFVWRDFMKLKKLFESSIDMIFKKSWKLLLNSFN